MLYRVTFDGFDAETVDADNMEHAIRMVRAEIGAMGRPTCVREQYRDEWAIGRERVRVEWSENLLA